MRIRAFSALVALAAGAGFGCTDAREAPLVPSGEVSAARAGRTPPTPVLTHVPVVQRTQPLLESVSVTAEIGKAGGVISLPEAGFALYIPQNALTPPARHNSVAITVTALRGLGIAYTFEPHGLTFRAPIYAVQDARGTRALGPAGLLQTATGAYFAAESQLGEGVADVSEFQKTYLDARGSRYFWEIDHFSGYLLAGNRSASYAD